MAKVTFQLEGQERLTVRVSQYEREFIRDLEKITTRGAGRVARAGKAQAPVRSGNLRRSIRQKDVSRRIGMAYRLAKTVTARGRIGNHLHLVQLGTRQRTSRNGGNRGRMPANPFLARAQASASSQFHLEIQERIRRRVEI